MLEDISLSHADTESTVSVTVGEVAVSLFPLTHLNKKLERGKESAADGPDRLVDDVCETEAATKNGNVDVVGGVDKIGISGYKSEGFTLSEILL